MSSQPLTNAPSSPPSAAANPSAPQGRSLFWSFKWSLIAILWLGTSILFAYILTARTPKIVAEWKEPDAVNYQNDDPYVIYVMDRSSVWDESNRYRYCTTWIVPQKNKNLCNPSAV